MVAVNVAGRTLCNTLVARCGYAVDGVLGRGIQRSSPIDTCVPRIWTRSRYSHYIRFLASWGAIHGLQSWQVGDSSSWHKLRKRLSVGAGADMVSFAGPLLRFREKKLFAHANSHSGNSAYLGILAPL